MSSSLSSATRARPCSVMHELSLVSSLFDTLLERAAAYNAREVTVVTIKVGPLSGVVPELLESAFDMYKKETIAAGARLVVEPLPFVVRCRACGAETPHDHIVQACPTCGSADLSIVQGTEVFLDKIEIDVD
jgi:hydrogenase nickel incorporation protein HypA/HybF